MRAKLVRAGDYEGLKALAAYEDSLRPITRVRGSRREGGALVLDVVSRFAKKAVRFDERMHWVPPDGVAFSEERDAREDVAKSDLYVFVRGEDRVEFALPVEFEVDGTTLRGTVRFDPSTAAAGSPLPAGEWDAFATLTVAGFKATSRLRRGPGEPLRLRVGDDGTLAEERPELRARLATRFPRAARLAKRAGL